MGTIITLLFAIAINLFGGIFLLASSGYKFRNRLFLGLFFLDSFVLFTGHFLSFQDFWSVFRWYDFLFTTSLLAFYPFYYQYLKNAFGYDAFSLNWKMHFVPAIFFGGAMGIMSLISDKNSYLEYMQSNVYGLPMEQLNAKILYGIYLGGRGFHVLQILLYNFLALRYMWKIRKKMSDEFSSMDSFQLQYFYVVNVSFLLLMAIPGIYVTIVGRHALTENVWMLPLFVLLFTLLYLVLGIVGFRQMPVSNILIDFTEPGGKKTPIRGGGVQKSDLLHYFETSNPWLNPTLNIWEVSQAIGLNRTYVSNIINGEFQCNFNTFVNRYRIEHAKKLLQNNTEVSMETLSVDSGFGSLSSFTRAFKSIEGISPRAYKDKLDKGMS